MYGLIVAQQVDHGGRAAVMPIITLLVAVATLSGTPIARFISGTHDAPAEQCRRTRQRRRPRRRHPVTKPLDKANGRMSGGSDWGCAAAGRRRGGRRHIVGGAVDGAAASGAEQLNATTRSAANRPSRTGRQGERDEAADEGARPE
jgi:hypothetical protein